MAYALTREDSAKGGRKSAELQRDRARQRMALSDRIGTIVQRVGNDELATLFGGASAELVVALLQGETPVVEGSLDYLRLVEAADKLHKMARLAAGEATSIAFGAHATVDIDVLEARLAALREARAQRAAAQADGVVDA